MGMTLEIEGLNLERLLRTAAAAGLVLGDVQRVDVRAVCVRLPVWKRKRLLALCERYGWQVREVSPGMLLRAARMVRKRCALGVAAALFVGLMYASSAMVWAVRVENAGENVAEVRRFLDEQGVSPGRFKRAFSTDALRDGLMLRLPGLSHVDVRFDGSTMVVSCQGARSGEVTQIAGEAYDIVAQQPGIITRLSVRSGTPQVQVGQAVRKGQVLIRGEERAGDGVMSPQKAQGEVLARVFAQGEARVSLAQQRTVETGRIRTRVTIKSPWHERVVVDAEPFGSQDVSVERQSVVGLYVPLWRRIETFAETIIVSERRSFADVASQAQGAAEKIAKLNCPTGVEILDKWVDYSMIDDEFVYATVVLEYETSIAGRMAP